MPQLLGLFRGGLRLRRIRDQAAPFFQGVLPDFDLIELHGRFVDHIRLRW